MVGMMAEMSVHLMVATTVVMMAQRSADLLVECLGATMAESMVVMTVAKKVEMMVVQ
jgi:hypothetical protein